MRYEPIAPTATPTGALRPPPRRRGLTGRFARSSRATALIEFCLILPFMLALFLGGFELTRFIGSLRKLTFASDSIAQMMAQNTVGTVSANDIAFMLDSTMTVFPDVLSDSFAKGTNWLSDISLTISSVKFTPTVSGCTVGCTYTATTVFSSGTNKRPCSVNLTAAPDSATPTTTTLPTDVYGPGSLIVVDVSYNYTPVVAAYLIGAKSIKRSTYLQPRYVSTITYDSSKGAGVTQVCS